MAEGGGFEPPTPFGEHDFQSCALNHSAIPPAPHNDRSAFLNRPSRQGQARDHLLFGDVRRVTEVLAY